MGDNFALLVYRIRDFRWEWHVDGSVTIHFERSKKLTNPTIQWYPSHDQLEKRLEEFTINNPAKMFWNPHDPRRMLGESLLSGHTDFEHHPASDLKRAIELL